MQARAAEQTDYYRLNASAKILTCQYLQENDPTEATRIAESLSREMIDSIDKFANNKQLISEIEHLDFLIELIADQAEKAYLTRLRDEIAAPRNNAF